MIQLRLRKELTNQRFGRLIAIRDIGTRNGARLWLCKCDCGNETKIPSTCLRAGNTKSCGCLKLDKFAAMARNRRIHKTPKKSAVNNLFTKYRARAKRNNRLFMLMLDEFEQLTSNDCFYCGSKPTQIHITRSKYIPDYLHNGIDRVDPTKGYSFDNCVSCCWTCNWMKKNLGQQDFYNHIARIYHNSVNV